MVMLPLNNDNWRSVFPVMAGDLSETIVTFGNASDGLLVAMVTNLQLPVSSSCVHCSQPVYNKISLIS